MHMHMHMHMHMCMHMYSKWLALRRYYVSLCRSGAQRGS